MRVVMMVAVVAVVAVVAPRLVAQTVQGDLVERVGLTPVEGAFVVLVDQQRREVARAMTDGHGRFTVAAPAPGRYRLRSKRIGFRPTESVVLQLAAGDTLSYRLEIEAVPVALAEVVVEGERQCDLRSDARAAAVAALWGEIREALAAVTWTAREPGYWYEVATFERDLAAERVVRRDSTTFAAGYYRSPFRAMPAAALERTGFIVPEGREWLFYAPDAEVLLSDAFLGAHCFETRLGRDGEAGLVGLAFTPVPGTRRPDVRGTLWVSAASGELRHLDYAYTNVPGDLPNVGAGGQVTFLRVPSGAWIVERWVIRMPLSAPPARVADQAAPAGLRETGGRVLTIRNRARQPIFTREPAILEGSIHDSTRGAGLPRATVSLVGTPYGATTGSEGRFRLEAPLDGPYDVIFAHPRLDSLGFRPTRVAVALRAGQPARLELGVPSERTLVAWHCPDAATRLDQRVILGVVRERPSGRPLAGALVEIAWQETRAVGGRVGVREPRGSGLSDESGAYVVCGVPAGRTVWLRARAGGVAGPDVRLGFETGSVAVGQQAPRAFAGRIWKQDLDVPAGGQPVTALELEAPTDTPTAVADALAIVGFSERRRTGVGRFITRSEFAPWRPATTTAVLARIPGVRMVAQGERRIADVGRGPASLWQDCPVAFVVDGMHVGNVVEIDIDAALPIVEVEAIEVYVGGVQVPQRFAGPGAGANCGVIAFWTRR
jgi:hypothetical protein